MTERLWRPWGAPGLLVAGTFAFSGAWLVARAASSGVPHDIAITMLGLAAALIAAVAVARWRLGIYLLLLWLVLEDLPRKFLGNDLLVYFGKDVLAFAVYLGFFLDVRSSHRQPFRPRFFLPLLLFAGICCVQIFNPNSPSPLYALLGLKLYLYYVPLALLGYALVRTEQDLRRFLAFNLALGAVVAAIGIVQGVVGPGFLNPAVTPEQLNLLRLVRRAPLTGEAVPRPTAIFVSDGRFAWYMLSTLFLGLAAVAYAMARAKPLRTLAVITLTLVAGAILLSGSRGTFLYGFGSLFVFAAALLWGFAVSARPRRTIGRAAAGAALAVGGSVLAAAILFPDAVGARWAFYYQTIAPWSPASELAYRGQQYPVAEFVKAFSYPHWALGNGIGTASLGVQYLTSVFDVTTTGAAVESGYGTLVVEMGLAGLIAWFMWTVSLVGEGLGVVRALRGSPLFPVAFGFLWFAFVLLFPLTYGGMQPYHNFVFNAFLWLLVGVLFRLPRLELAPAVTSPVLTAVVAT